MTTNEKAGLALIVASIATFGVLALHPTGRDVLDAAAAGTSNALDRGVHLVAIGAEAILLAGMLGLALRLTTQRDLAMGSFVVYAVAIAALVIAATASGLIAPSAAWRVAQSQGAARDIALAGFQFSGYITQSFARVGFSLASLAVVGFSVAMYLDGFSRALGSYGVILGVAGIIGFDVMNVSGQMHGFAGLAMAGQLVWTIWAGLLLRRVA